MCKTILAAIIVILLSAVSADAFVEVRSDRLEVDGKMIGKAVNEKEMDEMRGGYMGYSFSVLFQGWWDSLGGNTIGTTTTTGDSGTTNTSSSTPSTNIEAVVGGLGSARGIFSIIQVPGSNNIVTSNMIINIQIIQVLGNSVVNLPSMP